MTFADSKQRFSNRVADYVRYRPGYPTAVRDLLRAECGLKSGHVIADIGSGTGFLSELFLKNGNRVFGVEPNEARRIFSVLRWVRQHQRLRRIHHAR
jgi:precorrin-6B methylase 2